MFLNFYTFLEFNLSRVIETNKHFLLSQTNVLFSFLTDNKNIGCWEHVIRFVGSFSPLLYHQNTWHKKYNGV